MDAIMGKQSSDGEHMMGVSEVGMRVFVRLRKRERGR